MFIYAQINEENIVVGVSQLSGEVISSNLILIETFDVSLIGKRWNGSSFEDVY